jgi:hypothetical protein
MLYEGLIAKHDAPHTNDPQCPLPYAAQTAVGVGVFCSVFYRYAQEVAA